MYEMPSMTNFYTFPCNKSLASLSQPPGTFGMAA
jgi:hypothetical protein